MTRKKLNRRVKIADLKAKLSAYLREVKSGEQFTIVERNTPIALITGINQGGGEYLEVKPAVEGPAGLIDIKSPLKRGRLADTQSSLSILSQLRGER